ncbi:MAG: peptide deformylase [Patescibacteria group bacterium]|nr:peptide deformylase [Patescibacteria group bacterium]
MLEIIMYPNDILRQKSQLITDPSDPKIKKLISDMASALNAHNGIGLSAPQVGENVRLCIVEDENEQLVLINPKIKKYSGKEVVMEEGCLSFPGKFIPVKRHMKVKVKFFDASGKKQIIRAKGLLARVLQHEIDHLNGILFIDRPHE